MRFNCKIYHSDTNYVLMNQEFDNLTDLAKSLGLSYNQVADISSKKKKKKDYRCFKYFPTIEINKIYNNTNNNGKPETDSES